MGRLSQPYDRFDGYITERRADDFIHLVDTAQTPLALESIRTTSSSSTSSIVDDGRRRARQHLISCPFSRLHSLLSRLLVWWWIWHCSYLDLISPLLDTRPCDLNQSADSFNWAWDLRCDLFLLSTDSSPRSVGFWVDRTNPFSISIFYFEEDFQTFGWS